MNKYFLCYTQKNSLVDEKLLDKIKRKFLSEGIFLYVDLLDNKSISHQELWFKELVSSDKVVVLNKADEKKSRWMRQELMIAKLLNKPLIPLECESIGKL